MNEQTDQTAPSVRPTVLLGVTGCIAAYKSCEILRGLQKAGVRVKVVMTEHATEFVGPTTFRALTHEPVSVCSTIRATLFTIFRLPKKLTCF